ncbi:3-keto-disaccharide hydrolase [Pedosphaera parvula]|uniref:3-keto-alpha-glucoside-1,2-lyase/3-keto-2-hydroxy-glucal hydratase domain-containing protein n=1 Tax=Pedosphaera parvula (strain Ellin514) TaxID=320771 RepID=B9XM46_PEDPL|nr:DUF1080 domain-containing protein [Pedosphaera parvula]EEF59039.1 protein of unknown function DUF1080 [Pedosphaera parvula Ellin514]
MQNPNSYLKNLSVLIFVLLASACSTTTHKEQTKVVHLLNGKDLGPFYSFLKGQGTTNDPYGVFTITNGVLRVSGQDFGYLATKKDYSNYCLIAEFKWGEKAWEPRQKNARDSGILVHAVGKDQVWPKSIECQMIEGGTGDILVVSGAYLTVDGVTKGPRIERFDRPGRNPWKDELGFRGPHEIEKPHGEWNTIKVICDGNTVAISVNGHRTLAGTNAIPNAGKILLQTEGAEVFFRRLDLYPLQ